MSLTLVRRREGAADWRFAARAMEEALAEVLQTKRADPAILPPRLVGSVTELLQIAVRAGQRSDDDPSASIGNYRVAVTALPSGEFNAQLKTLQSYVDLLKQLVDHPDLAGVDVGELGKLRVYFENLFREADREVLSAAVFPDAPDL